MKIYRTRPRAAPVWNSLRSTTLTLFYRMTWCLDHQWLQLLNVLLSSEEQVNVSQPQAIMRVLLLHSWSIPIRHNQRGISIEVVVKFIGLKRDLFENSVCITFCPLWLGTWSLIGWTQKYQTVAKYYLSRKLFESFHITSKVLPVPIKCVHGAYWTDVPLLPICMNLPRTKALNPQYFG